MNQPWDVAIIGGGAAGLTAAIFAAESAAGGRIVLLEGSRQFGTKILASGGGRCNVTHEKVTPDDFSGSRNIVRNILASFDVPRTIAWFASLGVQLKREETGKLFPVTDSAHTVVNALTTRCRELGVTMVTNARVFAISPGEAFMITHASGVVMAHRAILATGGKSLPKSGSDGSGWEIARTLGHSVASTHQALAPLVLDGSFFHAQLSGLALEVELSTFVQNKKVDIRCGNMLFTHFGISGPAVMDASRFWIMAAEAGRPAEIRCNFVGGEAFESVERWLIESCGKRPKALLATILAERLPARLGEALLAHVGIAPAAVGGQLTRDSRRDLVHAITALPLPVTASRGWNYAEVTAGGVPLAEINFRTMESRKVPRLYLIGEMLDCDGRIGGFNFQWAWCTGHIAGRAAAAATVPNRERPEF